MEFHFNDNIYNQRQINLGDNISILIEKQSNNIASLSCIITATQRIMNPIPKEITIYNITTQLFIKPANSIFILNWMHDYIVYYKSIEINLINKREWNIAVNK